jgi:hypothetical protein
MNMMRADLLEINIYLTADVKLNDIKKVMYVHRLSDCVDCSAHHDRVRVDRGHAGMLIRRAMSTL